MIPGQPTAEVLSVVAQGDTLRTIIRLDDLPPEPIAPASLWSLSARDEAYELHKVVGRSGAEVTFETYGAHAPLPPVGNRYAFQTWWSAAQLALARDTERLWRREEFVARDGVVFRSESGTWVRPRRGDETAVHDGHIVPSGWDHEHCALCWGTISAYEGDEQEGYTDGSRWLCTGCFGRFIASGLGRRLG